MTDQDQARDQAWISLRGVAKPDSRFHYDFTKFIPDFEGSELATQRLLNLDIYREAKSLFITPDNCLEGLRERALRDGKTQIVPTYGIRRGMIELLPKEIPSGTERFAVLLDLIEDFGQPISLERLRQLYTIDLLVTGASVVSETGVRFGKGHGFFDLEWALLYEIGVVNAHTPIVALVHDCQVTDVELRPSPFDTVCDLIITPTRTIEIEGAQKPVHGVMWKKLAPGMLDEIPPLQELRKMKEHGSGLSE